MTELINSPEFIAGFAAGSAAGIATAVLLAFVALRIVSGMIRDLDACEQDHPINQGRDR